MNLHPDFLSKTRYWCVPGQEEEVWYVLTKFYRTAIFLRRWVNAAKDFRPKRRSSVACGLYTATSFWKKNWGGTTCVPVVLGSDSKNAVWRKVAFDGINRDHFFRDWI